MGDVFLTDPKWQFVPVYSYFSKFLFMPTQLPNFDRLWAWETYYLKSSYLY